MGEELTFSQRATIDKLFLRWCMKRDGSLVCPFNMLIYLDERGFLNRDKIRKRLTRQRINKVLHKKEG